MKYNSIGEQLIAKAKELDPNYKPDKFNDMSEAIDIILNNSGGSGYKIKKLYITENGLYDGEFEAYKPILVDVPQISENGTLLKTLLDTTKSTYYLFRSYKGTNIDNLIKYSDTIKVMNMSNMFSYCENLTNIPELCTSNVTNMYAMFEGCKNLITIPNLDTSNVNNMAYVFSHCNKLTRIPKLDTSNVTNMSCIFYGCTSLTTIPELDTSNVTDISSMFENCSNLTSVPQLDTSNVTNMYRTFCGCTSLTTIPLLNTSNVGRMNYTFSDCTNLTSIPQLDASKVDYSDGFRNIFSNCSSLTSIGMYGFRYSIDITQTALEHDAIVAFLNQAGIAYTSNQRITMGSAKLALLSDEEKAIATNKGWTLA